MGNFLATAPNTPKRLFVAAFVLTLALKLWFAYAVPITGDEALFYWWGTYLNWGYYDHPPMVGWMIALLKLFDDSVFVLRLFTVGTTFFVALGIVDLIGRVAPEAGATKWMAATLYLLMPITWFGVPVTNDTPLVFFLCLSAYFFLRGEIAQDAGTRHHLSRFREGFWWFFASGIALGLAFLSKYLAVAIVPAYVVVLLRRRGHTRVDFAHAAKVLFLMLVLVLPFVALNLVYNAFNCWNNIMFNAINRHDDASLGLKTPTLYLLMCVYLLTPWLLWGLWQSRRKLATHKALVLLALIPFVFFFALSFSKTIGLHWVLGFLPILFVLGGVVLSEAQLQRYVRLSAVFGLIHAIALLGFFAFPNFWLNRFDMASSVGFVYDATKIPAAVLGGDGEKPIVMAEGYSSASILGYHAKQYVPVFGVGSRYARQDDFQVDFRALDGKSFRILVRKERSVSDFSPFFERVAKLQTVVNGRPYWIIQGDGFNYAAYRQQVISEIYRRYYQIPSVLPMYSCPFTERYGFLSAR